MQTKHPSWQSGFITANGIKMHYTRSGGEKPPLSGVEKPPLVLAHGVTDDGLCWTPVAQALETAYDVIMVDARGHGRSEATEEGYDSQTQAEDLYGVISGLGLAQPIVMGHSMGAMTTLVMAGLHPETPRAILLEDPPPWWLPPVEPPPGQMDPRAGMAMWLNELKRKTGEELLEGQRAASPNWSEAELKPWVDSKLRVSPKVANIFQERQAAPIDWPRLLARVACPTLLITADPAMGAIITPESAQSLQALLPQAQVAHIVSAGHNIRREQFANYMQTVQDFLAQI